MNAPLAAVAARLLCLIAATLLLGSSLALAQVGAPAWTALQATRPAPDQIQTAMIVADVMIDGHGPFHFMLDTGATQAVIADTTVARLGLQPDPSKLVQVQGVNAHVVAPEVRVRSLIFGSLRFRGLDLPVLTGPMFDGLDGILGAQGLDRMKLSVSLRDRRCVIGASPRRPGLPAGATVVRLQSRQLPMVSATIGGVKVQVIIDTGASNTLGNTALLAALQKKGAVQALHAAPATLDVTLVWWAGFGAVTPPLQLGGVALQPPAVTFADYQVFSRWGLSDRPAMLLGMDALATLAGFSIDYPRLQLQMLPRPAAMVSVHPMQPRAALRYRPG